MVCKTLPVRFTLSLAMVPPEEIVPLAQLAEATGWDAIAMPDSVFFPETVSGDYPYTSDGSRFWDADVPFTDPFVAIPAMAAVTERLVFYTNVYKVVLRQPLLVAKMLGSLAAMFEGRIGLGLGLSWMPEEFAWLGEEMKTRGKRLDETIEILRRTLTSEYVEYHGDHYDFDRLKMSPAPTRPVPLYVGGHSAPAIRRATRSADGWIGAQLGVGDLRQMVHDLHAALEEQGRDPVAFEIKATPLVLADPDAMGTVFDAGVTDVITVPWLYHGPGPHTLAEKTEHLEAFATEVIAPLKGSNP